ncbi:endonuclease/exonuclease/phosphatase family protein, partial [Frankia sp. R82]|uniref:endonuclease/exonuclease/phosphatase family protein n=1 Tax=Frankia sp. R82 TaxID=2950553 RepID=UPI002043A4BB
RAVRTSPGTLAPGDDVTVDSSGGSSGSDAADAAQAADGPQRPSRGRRTWTRRFGQHLGRQHGVERVGRLAALGVAGVLLLCVGARLTHFDDLIGWPFPAVNAFTPLLCLPAYPLIGYALVRRSRLLAAGMVATAALHLTWTVPEFVRVGQGHHLIPRAAEVRLMTANVNGWNTGVARIATQLDQEKPAVLLLEEYTPLIAGQLRAVPALRDFRYSVLRPSYEPFGYAVYSRYPLTTAPDLHAAGFPFGRMTVTLPSGNRFELVVVHTRSPVGGAYTRRWADQLDALRTEVSRAEAARTGGAGARIPLVLAGDFNATRDHRPFRRLLGAGLRDAHDVAGAGWSPTWSATARWKETTRIDHILVSSDVTVDRYHRGAPFGSDHLPISADLQL